MEQAEADGVSAPVRKRLKFDEGKLRDVMAGISDLTGMEDPLFQTQFARELDEGLVLKRVTCPIGVIGVILRRVRMRWYRFPHCVSRAETARS